MSSDKELKKIRVSFILEVIGRPPEHLVETLEGIIKTIGDEKGVEIKEKKVNEPIALKEQDDLYTSFAEIEFEIEDIVNLSMLILKYMPSHIEIISPEKIISTNNGLNDMFNEIARRLHGYDEVARLVQTEKGILENKLKEILKNNEKKE